MSRLFVYLQKILPKHLLSRIVGAIAMSEIRSIKTLFIFIFRQFAHVDLSEAERERPIDYVSFNDFFTRALKPGLRPVTGEISSPADGTVAALGRIADGTLIQSKGHRYALSTLLGQEDVSEYLGGSFITIYLAPHNYHRVHTPCDAQLHSAKYIPGALFSVNQATAKHQPNLLALNERLVCRFRTNDGPLAAVLVGAMLVAGIQPIWLQEPYKPRLHVTTEMGRKFSQGAELGRFQMGSTVVLVFTKPIDFAVTEGQIVKVGQALV